MFRRNESVRIRLREEYYMRRLILALFSALLFAIPPLIAQSPNGTISGVVFDTSGAPIAGAEIVIANDSTGLQYVGKTNAEGMYVVPNLPPGVYRVQVSKIGFKTLIKPDVTLSVQDALAINFTLPVGALRSEERRVGKEC